MQHQPLGVSCTEGVGYGDRGVGTGLAVDPDRVVPGAGVFSGRDPFLGGNMKWNIQIAWQLAPLPPERAEMWRESARIVVDLMLQHASNLRLQSSPPLPMRVACETIETNQRGE